jgi:hypothetical protein
VDLLKMAETLAGGVCDFFDAANGFMAIPNFK